MLILVVGLPNVLHQDIWRRKLKGSRAVSADLVLAEWMGLPRFRSSQVPRGWDLNLFARYRCIHGTRVAWTTPHRSTDSNNNNNPIWGCSVLTGEEPPPHSGETSHALSQVGGPTQSQLSRPMSLGHHISMEHRPRKKHLLLNSDTNPSNETYLEE